MADQREDPGVQFNLATGDLPTRESETQLPATRPTWRSTPGDKVFVANLKNVTKARPNTKTYPQISQAIGSQMQGVLIGQMHPRTPWTRRPAGGLGSARPGSDGAAQARVNGRATLTTGAPAGALPPRRRAGCADGWWSDTSPAGASSSPAVVLIGLFGLVPVVWAFVLSFEQQRPDAPGTWIGLDNYRSCCTTRSSSHSVRNTILYTVVFVPVCSSARSVGGGAEPAGPRHAFYRLAVFIPVVTSTVATAIMFNWLLDPDFGHRERRC